MSARKYLINSLVWSGTALLLAVAAFLSFGTRFTEIGLQLVRIYFFVDVVAFILCIIDFLKAATRPRAFLALLFFAPVILSVSFLNTWEGPLYVGLTNPNPASFNVAGPACFYGISIYSSEHDAADTAHPDRGLTWRVHWQNRRRYPAMSVRFQYGVVPTGYLQDFPASSAMPQPLDPDSTYTVEIEPGMGTPEYFTLRGGSLVRKGKNFLGGSR